MERREERGRENAPSSKETCLADVESEDWSIQLKCRQGINMKVSLLSSRLPENILHHLMTTGASENTTGGSPKPITLF